MEGAKETAAVEYRMKLRGAGAAVREGGEKIEDEAGNPPAQLFRFEVHTADGGNVKCAIAIGDEAGAEQHKTSASSTSAEEAAELEVSDLVWSKKDHQHGAEATLHARVHGHEGGAVRFVVEHDEGGTWRPYAIVPATVKNGEAAGKLRLHHPVLPPSGHAPALAEIRKAKPAQLRFRVEKG